MNSSGLQKENVLSENKFPYVVCAGTVEIWQCLPILKSFVFSLCAKSVC